VEKEDIKKVRRRIEDYLRKATDEEILRIAKELKLKIKIN